MATDCSEHGDLESQSTAASDARSIQLADMAPGPHAPPDRPRSRESISNNGSLLSRSFVTNIPPATDTSSRTLLQGADNGPCTRQKFTGSHGSGMNLQPTSSHHTTNQRLREGMSHRYMGYPAFSSLLSCDDDAFVVRKFGTLHVRTILMLQDRIVQREARLAEIDKDVGEGLGEEHLCHNGSFRADQQWHQERYEIILELAGLLEQYDSLVLKYSQLKQQPKAPKRTLKNLQMWFKKYPLAVTNYERAYLSHERRDDLIATTEREKAPLRRGLEKFSSFRRWKVFRLRTHESSNEYQRTYGDEGIVYYDDDVVDKVIIGVILFLGIFMLLVPVWLLNQLPSHTTRLAIITGFITLFVGLLLLVTPSKPFETIVGTAAYGALLMVFMQIGE